MNITLLDGGMGQELVHRAGDRPTPLWSTHVMQEHPGLVAQVHRDFTQAGATIATTNTYAIHRDRLVDTGFEDQFEALHACAMDEAANSGATRIAGSIGPMIASYRPDLHPAADIAIPVYAEIVNLIGPKCDLLICETVCSLDHAASILQGAAVAGKPVWLAVSVDEQDGTRLRSGEALSDVVPIALEHGAGAILINCTAPESVPAALAVLATSGLPFGAYANGFERITDGFLEDKPTVDALRMRFDFTPELYADHAMAWIEQGATIVGGCCEVSPAHISEMARRIRAAGHTIV